jgi:hypothetical protein
VTREAVDLGARVPRLWFLPERPPGDPHGFMTCFV